MNNNLNNSELYIQLNSGNIINKYYVENGVIKENENFDLYFNTSSNSENVFLQNILKCLNALELEFYSDKNIHKSRDTDLIKALTHYKINTARNDMTSVVLIKENSFFSLNQRQNAKPKDIKDLIMLIKRNFTKILNADCIEKVIYNRNELGKDFSGNDLIIESDDKKEFLISNVVFYTLIKLIYKTDLTEVINDDVIEE